MGLSRLRPPIRVRVYGRHTMNKINARSRHELFRRLNLASLRHKKKKKIVYIPSRENRNAPYGTRRNAD